MIVREFGVNMCTLLFFNNQQGAWQAITHGVERVGPDLVTNTYHKRLSDLSVVVLVAEG